MAIQVHPCLCTRHCWAPLYGWVKFHCTHVPRLLCPFLCWWILQLLPCLGYCKRCIAVRAPFQTMSFSGFMPGSGIAVPCDSSNFSFLRNLHAILHSDRTNSHSYPQHRRVWMSALFLFSQTNALLLSITVHFTSSSSAPRKLQAHWLSFYVSKHLGFTLFRNLVLFSLSGVFFSHVSIVITYSGKI